MFVAQCFCVFVKVIGPGGIVPLIWTKFKLERLGIPDTDSRGVQQTNSSFTKESRTVRNIYRRRARIWVQQISNSQISLDSLLRIKMQRSGRIYVAETACDPNTPIQVHPIHT
eukprot:905658-Rhodomonas_salina.4